MTKLWSSCSQKPTWPTTQWFGSEAPILSSIKQRRWPLLRTTDVISCRIERSIGPFEQQFSLHKLRADRIKWTSDREWEVRLSRFRLIFSALFFSICFLHPCRLSHDKLIVLLPHSSSSASLSPSSSALIEPKEEVGWIKKKDSCRDLLWADYRSEMAISNSAPKHSRIRQTLSLIPLKSLPQIRINYLEPQAIDWPVQVRMMPLRAWKCFDQHIHNIWDWRAKYVSRYVDSRLPNDRSGSLCCC